MSLPKAYAWLEKEPGPRMLLEAIKLVGTYELPGAADNPTLLEWAKSLGLGRVYTHDSVPWCGLFMAKVASEAGWTPPESPLWAQNWKNFGVPAEHGAELGDVLVYVREGGGHVNLYIGETKSEFVGIGGNQSDAVNIRAIPKARCIAQRRPMWRISEPPNRRKIFLSSSGAISTTEK